MKNILLFLSVIILVSCGTEKAGPETLKYQKETEVSAEKSLIRERSIEWVQKYYPVSGEIKQLNGKRNYRIIGTDIVIDQDEKIYCTLDIDIRDNKFRVTYKNISYDNGREVNQIILKKLEPKLNTAIYNLREVINAS